MDLLVSCTNCSRHVKCRETSCPFCGTSLRSASALRSLSRAALLVVGATALAGCPEDAGSMRALYGAPPMPPIEAGTTVTVTPPDAAAPDAK